MAEQSSDVVFESSVTGLELIGRGKVRDLWAVDEDHLLIVATDRLSAYDVVLPDPIPGKGAILTRISRFWFAHTEGIVPNHLSDLPLEAVIADPAERALLSDRSMVVRRLQPLPMEAVVRGYLIGSGWRDYRATGAVCGIALPPGLPQAARLDEALFTPATKAAAGDHDENISFDTLTEIIGRERAMQVRELSLRIYTECADYARQRGIIIADTKFEFGVDENGILYLIDEVLTPDSSRFWPAASWRTGASPPSFDKQYVRDYLDTLDWDKRAPGPCLPAEVIARTRDKYLRALELLTGESGSQQA
ncbi:phosphoribosylaminoimidazolesuccinocarboxamide synthase [Lentisalinibacter salinarum]|uniref:phosphoribosylaminoimidazolesuccinocarboxamide synthase n=1 Tax=Lentisalinibacter salinarum TaxID=2992239 RepID=UPI0038674B6F